MSTDMQVAIDLEFLSGNQNEIVVKELSVVAKNEADSFRIRSPYMVTSHGSDENGLNCEDGHIVYYDLYTVVSEAVARFPHLYYYVIKNANFSTKNCVARFLTCRISTVHNPYLLIVHVGAT